MIPLRDMTQRRSFPIITTLLIAVNIAIFVYQLSLPQQALETFINTYALIPWKMHLALEGRHYTLLQAFLPLVTCMFLHGGFLHIIGNMLFLWIFGGNVENRLGSFIYLPFYLVCGIGSGISQAIVSWGSHVPSLGASGAISGVLGAYLIFFPTSRILTLVPLLLIFFLARIPAFVLIVLWFIVQFLSGVNSLASAGSGGVAWWAHVGGFLLGVTFALILKPSRRANASW
jgi:membrane associated rhomboid family serine protease